MESQDIFLQRYSNEKFGIVIVSFTAKFLLPTKPKPNVKSFLLFTNERERHLAGVKFLELLSSPNPSLHGILRTMN